MKKFLMVEGRHRTCAEAELKYEIVEAIYMPDEEEPKAYMEGVVRERYPAWKNDKIYINDIRLNLDKQTPWATLTKVQHSFNRKWVGFIPAEHVMALFEPTTSLLHK